MLPAGHELGHESVNVPAAVSADRWRECFRGEAMKRSRIRPIRSKPRKGTELSPAYLDFMHTQRCLLAGRSDTVCEGMLNAHHVDLQLADPRNDYRTVPLCEAHHLNGFGPDAIHKLGRTRWQEKFDIDLEVEIKRLRQEYQEAA
jgi:hypothetical protein